MAKKTKTKKSSSKVTKEQVLAQNEAIGEQLAGLQMEVEYLDEEVAVLIDENDELEEKNDALQSVIVDQQATNSRLNEKIDQQESLLKLADVVIDFAGVATDTASDRIKELEQENFHLSIQRDALRDRVKSLEARTPVDVKVYTSSGVYQFNS